MYQGKEYISLSGFGLAVLKSQHNPCRKACYGWGDVKWNGKSMTLYRAQCLKLMREAGVQLLLD